MFGFLFAINWLIVVLSLCHEYYAIIIRSLFLSDKDDDDALCRLVVSWKKFCALTDLLVYNLSEVAEWLPKRKFSSFTGSEMTSLLKALFEDTPRRRTVLNSILEMSS
jgi:hypothetical protein